MHTYYFVFGNTPKLSLEELQATAKGSRVTKVTNYIASVELSTDQAAQSLMSLLGGTIKVIREIVVFDTVEEPLLLQEVTKVLTRENEKTKIVFGISEIGRDHLPVYPPQTIKNHLLNLGYSVQFKDGPRAGLPGALLLHKPSIQEIVLMGSHNGTIVGKTVAVQDIDAWTVVDREKPYADRKKGMLPPKVARMMLNWGLSETPSEAQPVIYDPFCGSGTVLLEALAIGKTNLVGSDLDPESVRGTRENVAWYSQEIKKDVSAEILLADVSKAQLKKPVDLIITEPFLGKPKPTPAKVPLIFKGLEKLYKGAFKHWTTLLNDQATVVIVMPTVVIPQKNDKMTTYSMQKFIDSLSNLGYTTSSEPIEYSRSQAVVRRTLYKLTYTKQNT